MPKLADNRRTNLYSGAVVVAALCAVGLIWKTNFDVVNAFEKYRKNTQPSPSSETAPILTQKRQPPQSLISNGQPNDGSIRNNADEKTQTQPGPKFHIVFSTGCSIFQDWQSYTFFYFAMTSGQPGEVTRVASGCSAEETVALEKQFEEQIQTMSPHFHLHITPDFSRVVDPKKVYKFFNKVSVITFGDQIKLCFR